ncbi:20S proteasome subunit beta 1 [Nematocida homosporus]|uniref:20S proteasome subunit beta 1 n=1 Tax=Nematocida homosporus TaxID=1912981 RepID=UPI00221FEA6B|nr:20S proteasome subunit beta 1 [Nematocida homosporus]KAI5184794.1 20S proteasome subunit beta 1 [Nematocida homosporus]
MQEVGNRMRTKCRTEHWGREEVTLGTTIMAIQFRDGVILGADTRTSMGTYVSNRVSRKITKIANGIYTCRSGSAADTQAVAEIVSHRLHEQEVCYNEPPTVEDAATLAKKVIYQNSHLVAGMIIAGVDAEGSHVFSIPLGGTLIRQSCAIAGSGSIYMSGLCDQTYREDMTREEAIKFVRRAISHAIYRDNSSGGCIRMMIVTAEGTEELFIPGSEISITD